MINRSFSAFYALKNVFRRKQRNIFGVLGIGLGVSLLLGVQISTASLQVGWENYYLSELGEFEAELFPIQERYLNESAFWQLKDVTDNFNVIQAITGRLILDVSIFEPNSGRVELNVPLLGIPVNEMIRLSSSVSQDYRIFDCPTSAANVRVQDNMAEFVSDGEVRSKPV